jgi:hypothetical protein
VQLDQRAKDAALQSPAGERGKDALHRIGPRAGGGGEMKPPTRVPVSQAHTLGCW